MWQPSNYWDSYYPFLPYHNSMKPQNNKCYVKDFWTSPVSNYFPYVAEQQARVYSWNKNFQEYPSFSFNATQCCQFGKRGDFQQVAHSTSNQQPPFSQFHSSDIEQARFCKNHKPNENSSPSISSPKNCIHSGNYPQPDFLHFANSSPTKALDVNSFPLLGKFPSNIGMLDY